MARMKVTKTGRKTVKKTVKKTIKKVTRKIGVRTSRAPGKKSRPASPARKNAVATQVKPSKNAEIIVRQGFVIDATGGAQHAVPEVLIFGNREGLQYLSEVFARLAEQAKSRAPSAEPAEELQLGRDEHPINARLSDALEFRFGALTAANRAATFKRHGITMKSREKGSLFERYQEVAETKYTKIARQIHK